MLLRRLIIFTVLAPLCLSPLFANAHHSVVATFDTARTSTITGVVTRVWYKNPHVRYHVVVDTHGEDILWNTHGHNISALTRVGWTRNTIKVGDKITMSGDATRDGSPKMFVRTVVLANGKLITNGSTNADAPLPDAPLE